MSFRGSREIKAYIRSIVPTLKLDPSHEVEIIDELVMEFEAHYQSALASGLTPEEAWQELQRRMPDWKQFGRELLAIYGTEKAADPVRSAKSSFFANLARLFE